MYVKYTNIYIYFLSTGVSHSRSYILFRLGRRVSAPVRQFAESGRSDALGSSPGTLDVFGAPAINQGAGRTEAEFFVDGNHSRVSLDNTI